MPRTCQLALARAARLPAITVMRSFHELTNAFAPSSWSCVARASMSIPAPAKRASRASPSRSEEHTSELQSQFHLVCRLLLEKKKTTTSRQYYRSLTSLVLDA